MMDRPAQNNAMAFASSGNTGRKSVDLGGCARNRNLVNLAIVRPEASLGESVSCRFAASA